jgi:putative choline sulfate-utilization transcription factor
MANPRRLPPLQALAFFEAAARLANFTAAAEELGTTQPAVSHRIAWLEEDLGVPLFKRLHRGVALTADGVRLFEAVHEGLEVIRTVVADIRTHRTRKVLTLATDFGFASCWMMPRLSELRELMPELDIRLVTSQNQFDIRGEAVDFAIAFGDGQWAGCSAERLCFERVQPLCSPAFLAQHGPLADAAALARLPLLHLEAAAPERWLSWDDFFARQGLRQRPAGHDITLNTYPFVLQAALSGQGVALGWRPLVDELLASGQLVAALDAPVETERGYFLVQPQRARLGAAQQKFRDWMIEACRG